MMILSNSVVMHWCLVNPAYTGVLHVTCEELMSMSNRWDISGRTYGVWMPSTTAHTSMMDTRICFWLNAHAEPNGHRRQV